MDKYGEKKISEIALEVFDNPAPDNNYNIHIEYPEFTCRCPRTGYPDFATIIVDYIPGKYCLELTSWKLWINSFRETYKYHEAVVNEVFNHLLAILKPKQLKVTGDFNPRENVKTIVEVVYE